MKTLFKTFLLAGLALILSAPAFAQTVAVSSGRTSIELNSGTLGILGVLNVQLSASGLGRLTATNLSFPITSGAVDPATLKAEISHAGGLTVQLGTTVVQLTNFTIDTTGDTPQLSALAIAGGSVLGRVKAFDLGLPSDLAPPLAPAGNALIDIAQVQVTLSKDGADALNKIFATGLFSQGIKIGTARVKALLDADAIQ